MEGRGSNLIEALTAEHGSVLDEISELNRRGQVLNLMVIVECMNGKTEYREFLPQADPMRWVGILEYQKSRLMELAHSTGKRRESMT